MCVSRELDGIRLFEKAVFEVPALPEGSRGELVFFEGPNGCGKTTIAQAIALGALQRPGESINPIHFQWVDW